MQTTWTIVSIVVVALLIAAWLLGQFLHPERRRELYRWTTIAVVVLAFVVVLVAVFDWI